MAPKHQKSDGVTRGVRSAGDDAFKLTVDYLKQEAIEPAPGARSLPAVGRHRVARHRRRAPARPRRDPAPSADRDRHRAHRGLVLGARTSSVAVLGIGVAGGRRLAHQRRTRTGEADPRTPARTRGTGDRDEGRNQLMASTASTASTARKGGRITREDLQAAYNQMLGEGEATRQGARAADRCPRWCGGGGHRHLRLPGRPPARAQPFGSRRDPTAVGNGVDG